MKGTTWTWLTCESQPLVHYTSLWWEKHERKDNRDVIYPYKINLTWKSRFNAYHQNIIENCRLLVPCSYFNPCKKCCGAKHPKVVSGKLNQIKGNSFHLNRLVGKAGHTQ
jgi:hypothetical protein